MAKKDDLTLLIEALKKREEILQKGQSVSRYNHYFDRMNRYAKQLIEANRQDEIAPLLESDSISIRFDVAGLLFRYYPDKCTRIFEEISQMSVQTGLPKYLGDVRLDSKLILERLATDEGFLR